MERARRAGRKANLALEGLLQAALAQDGQRVVGLVREGPDLVPERAPVLAITSSWMTKQKHKAASRVAAEAGVEGVEAEPLERAPSQRVVSLMFLSKRKLFLFSHTIL